VSSLEGRTILVTRPPDQAQELVERLEARGAAVLLAPAIRIEPHRSAALRRALTELGAGRYRWITLTSRATVTVLQDALDPEEVRAKVAAVGDGTASAFETWAGRPADLVPRVFETEALARGFPRGEGRVLCLRADIASHQLEEALRTKGWSPSRVDAYRTVVSRRLPAGARDGLRRGEVDAVTLTSASTVRGFVRALLGPPVTEPAGRPRFVCMGPVTAREARALGLPVAAVARPHSIDGLVEAVERAVRSRRPPRILAAHPSTPSPDRAGTH
jgi:uroporphyrinogen-III synthase